MNRPIVIVGIGELGGVFARAFLRNGLPEGTTTETLTTQHNELVRTIAMDVIDIQEWLTEVTFEREKLIDGLVEGVFGDPQHICKGRAARERFTRVLDIADGAGLQIPRIRELQAHLI
jgi:hypothetical protein